ncbi:TonB-dependent receptor domain-containing protein [Vibrio tritonius]|uniref:TonB-dependent receptor domain-containing protein n=1 Tax=Vibrio tritonius TaxID=1435069 RepID=UPI0008394463|nr:TonB-dependent receptor [Vibrio tritonius]
MKKSLIAVAVVSTAAHVHAANSQSSSINETVVVTANRFEQPQSAVLASVSIITRQDIESMQADSALEVLRTLPGVEINSLGGKAQDTSIYIRGTSTQHTLVLVDGVKINSATSGGASIGLIPAFAIEKIEVIRGPRAAIYGSDALGGVISITTAGKGKSLHKATIGYGDNNHKLLGWHSSGQLNEQTHGSFIAAKEKSDGHRVYQLAPSEDKHGYDSTSFFGSVNHQFNDQWRLEGSAYKQESDNEYASQYGGPKQESNNDFYSLIGGVNFQVDNYNSKLTVSTAHNEAWDGDANGSSGKSALFTRRNNVVWLNTLTPVDEVAVNIGLDYTKVKAHRGGTSTTDYDDTSKDNKAGFLTSLISVNEFTAEASVRHDDDSSFGGHSTWNVGLGYQLMDSLQVVANSGTGFKAPTFNDLYWPGQGNPELKPEESISNELGLRGYSDWIDWEVSVYKTDIDNLIEWAPVGAGGAWIPANVNKARIKGLEVSAIFDTWSIEHKLSAEWKDPINKETHEQLARRGKQNFSWLVSYNIAKFDLSMVANYVGDRRDNNNDKMGSYTTVDLATRYHFTDHFSMGVKVSNAFNESYVTGLGSGSYYYMADGRNVFASAEYKF